VIKRHAPATERNRAPLLEVLQSQLPATGVVLEIAAGSGQHAAYFAPLLAPRLWLPTDVDAANVASINEWCAELDSEWLLPTQHLDVLDTEWVVEHQALPETVSAIVNINMLHIAPWACCHGLFAGAKRILGGEGVVLIYGPFKQNGQHTAASNEAFDANLRGENASWGIRDIAAVTEVAREAGFERADTIAMPANNQVLVFHQQ
jgi:hypothetical protein